MLQWFRSDSDKRKLKRILLVHVCPLSPVFWFMAARTESAPTGQATLPKHFRRGREALGNAVYQSPRRTYPNSVS